MAQTDGGEKVTPEQIAEIEQRIRVILAERVYQRVLDLAKTSVNDSAGKITPADLEFGSLLQREWYKPRPAATTAGKIVNYAEYLEVGKMGTPSKSSPPRVKRKPLWKRLASRLHSNRQSKETKSVDKHQS